MTMIGAIRKSMGHVGMALIGAISYILTKLAAMALIGAIRNILRKLAVMALSSPQIPHEMSCLALHLNGLLVETVLAG